MNMNVSISHLRLKQKEVNWNFNFKCTQCKKKSAKSWDSVRVDCFPNDHYQAHYMLIIFIWKTKALKCVQKVSYI